MSKGKPVESEPTPQPFLKIGTWATEISEDPLRRAQVIINPETLVIIGEVKLSPKGQWGFRALGTSYVLSSKALREIADRIDTAGLAVAS